MIVTSDNLHVWVRESVGPIKGDNECRLVDGVHRRSFVLPAVNVNIYDIDEVINKKIICCKICVAIYLKPTALFI